MLMLNYTALCSSINAYILESIRLKVRKARKRWVGNTVTLIPPMQTRFIWVQLHKLFIFSYTIHMNYSIFIIVNRPRTYKVTFTLDSVFRSFEACVDISYTAIAHHHLGLPNNRMQH